MFEIKGLIGNQVFDLLYKINGKFENERTYILQ